jgi:hypothetical protein
MHRRIIRTTTVGVLGLALIVGPAAVVMSMDRAAAGQSDQRAAVHANYWGVECAAMKLVVREA